MRFANCLQLGRLIKRPSPLTAQRRRAGISRAKGGGRLPLFSRGESFSVYWLKPPRIKNGSSLLNVRTTDWYPSASVSPATALSFLYIDRDVYLRLAHRLSVQLRKRNFPGLGTYTITVYSRRGRYAGGLADIVCLESSLARRVSIYCILQRLRPSEFAELLETWRAHFVCVCVFFLFDKVPKRQSSSCIWFITGGLLGSSGRR